MSRIKKAFREKAKIAYLTAGDGGKTKSIEYFLALVEGGANLLEVGIPYSDPVADGPVIQRAMERALELNTDITQVLEIVAQIRQKSEVAMILFTYYNPVQNNLASFLTAGKLAGADGVLIVDLPFEEAANYKHLCKSLDLSPITVVAPSTSANRMQQILADLDNGFVYYACQKGTTGTRASLPIDLAEHLANIRQATNLPIAVGFGIADKQMVDQILALSDGCVIGSYLVQQIENKIEPGDLAKLTSELFI